MTSESKRWEIDFRYAMRRRSFVDAVNVAANAADVDDEGKVVVEARSCCYC